MGSKQAGSEADEVRYGNSDWGLRIVDFEREIRKKSVSHIAHPTSINPYYF